MQELDSLGGGDTRVGELEVCVRGDVTLVGCVLSRQPTEGRDPSLRRSLHQR